jgi:tetratricopeptide (TPR) repeat protein
MFMAKLNEISHLNKVGASYLAVGDGGKAMKAFKGALVIMSDIAQDPAAGELFACSHQHCTSVDIPGLDGDSFFVYNKALLFESSDQIDLSFTNAILLFNMALTFHQRGRVANEESKLRKSQSLYKLSSELVPEISSCSGALLLAALNNQTHIHFELGDYEQFGATLKIMEKEASEICPAECSSSPFTQEHFDQFYLNIAVTRPPSAAPCA